MYYYETENKTGKRIGLIAGIAYLVIWGVLLLVLNFSLPEKQTGQGILINFGDTENASGKGDPRDNSVAPKQSQQRRQTAPQRTPEPIATQDNEEAPEIAQTAPQRQNQPTEVSQPGETTPAETTPVEEQPRVADPRLNFPGRTPGSTSSSEGVTEGAGNQGAVEGAPEGSHEGTGIGADGNSFDLTGRSIVGQLPKPAYNVNKGGRVIVEITVDTDGKVVNAQYRPGGSTTNESELINAALRAARQSRFSRIEGEGLQMGTITYNFKLQ